MNFKIKNEIIEKIQLRISKSETFAKSPRSIRLLKFLVQKALNNEDVKEDILGLELFKSKYNPNQKDSKVRVYMYNLRNKLAEYYANEGSADEIVFDIPKGQYNLLFINRELEIRTLARRKNKRILFTILSSVILFGIALIFISKKGEEKDCWDYFFNSPENTICIISDHFVVQQDVDDKYMVSNIEGVNNETELAKYLMKYSNEKVRIPDFTFLTKMAPIVIQRLTKWFVNHNNDFEILMESEFSYENMRKNNIIFVGQYNTMNDSKEIFLKESKVFKVLSDGFILNGDTSKIYGTRFDGMNKIEYAMVSFIPLGNKREVLFFTSNHDVGVMATVSNFTDVKWLKGFYSNFPEGVKYFNALYEVKGIKRTELNCRLVAIEYIE